MVALTLVLVDVAVLLLMGVVSVVGSFSIDSRGSAAAAAGSGCGDTGSGTGIYASNSAK